MCGKETASERLTPPYTAKLLGCWGIRSSVLSGPYKREKIRELGYEVQGGKIISAIGF